LKIGTRTRYGLRTLLEIASNKNEGGVFQKDISINQSLSIKYLDHIIHSLKTSGLITNVKGKKSGYKLARKPEEISIYDVHKAFEPELCLVECLTPAFDCERSEQCLARGAWNDLNLMIVNYMKSISLADMINQQVFLENLKVAAKPQSRKSKSVH
jgi:Rrf2 family protein